jgi:hypothetical protein
MLISGQFLHFSAVVPRVGQEQLMKRILTALIAASALGTALPAAAQPSGQANPSVHTQVPDLAAQQYSLQQRIRAGVRQGQIMQPEADRVLGELKGLHDEIAVVRQSHDGTMPDTDAIAFSGRIDQLSRSIHWGPQVTAQPKRQAEAPPSGQLQNTQGLCLQTPGGRASAGAPIRLGACPSDPNTAWHYEHAHLRGPGGMCLQVSGTQAYPGAPLKLDRCELTASNRWRFEGSQIVGMTGLCIQVVGNGRRPGADVRLNRCEAQDVNNQWHWME